MNYNYYNKLRNNNLYKKFRHTFIRDLGRLIDSPATEGLVLLAKFKKRFRKPANHILVTAMPKSGSTFLTRVLADLTGYREYRLNYECNQNEQDFYLPRLITSYGFDTITHQHVRATVPNLRLLKDFAIKPIILVRNIFDVVISFRDHLHQESLKAPSIYVNEKFYELDEQTKLDFIIEFALSWYFYFYASWYDACFHGDIDAIWITYEQLMSEKIKTIESVLNFCSINKSVDEIEQVINTINQKRNTRLNKGISGRGLATLSADQIRKVEYKASFYPWVDFSKIGITNNSPKIEMS